MKPILIAAWIAATSSALAQTSNATLSGVVIDRQERAVASATVTWTDPARGSKRPVASRSSGTFSFSRIAPSTCVERGQAPRPAAERFRIAEADWESFWASLTFEVTL